MPARAALSAAFFGLCHSKPEPKAEAIFVEREAKPAAVKEGLYSPGLAGPVGDFYVPGFASDGRTGSVPGAPDTHRRFFLARASTLEPELLATLKNVPVKDKRGLSAWAKRWHLTDQWCVLLARDTARWWTSHPSAEGWEFEHQSIFAGSFPFTIEPLRFREFYHDPTWRRRKDFEKYVHEQVRQALKDYCDRIERGALAAGLKRAPRRRELEHFDWIVRYQIKRESFASIARNGSYKFMGGRQTVRKAIVELAEYLELTLRPSTS
jgi:hypothetical protein